MSAQQADTIYPPTKAKGQGGVRGAPCGHQKPRKSSNGLYFSHGNGCSKWNDCLTCPFEKCARKSDIAKLGIKEQARKTAAPITKAEVPIWKPRACTRCHGDMYLSDEPDEDYICLQCGHTALLYEPLVFTRAKWIGKPQEIEGDKVRR